MEQPQQQQHLLHFCDSNHPLLFLRDARWGDTCCGCQESVYGPTYFCKEDSKLYVTSTSSTSPILILKLDSINPTPDSVNSVFKRNRENINLQELKEGENEDPELDQSVGSAAYKVKNIKEREDGTEIAIEIRHFSHEHGLKLSDDEVLDNEKCNGCCDSKISPIFRCTTCKFALDFKCATLPQTARYKQHEHPFTLRYTAEDESSEYYCDICEEERNSKHWFYYCANCDYPTHTKCILGKNPNVK
uniref:DC1 domain-containing protein n=1 Tax=Quercus lobata TaxID=97700 RepID=A0A7N2L5E1_QUELO